MKISIELNSKKILILSVVLVFLLLVTSITGARKAKEAAPAEQPNIAVQFGSSFACMIMQCGWPALVFLILPAVAVFIWKKIFSVG